MKVWSSLEWHMACGACVETDIRVMLLYYNVPDCVCAVVSRVVQGNKVQDPKKNRK